MRASRLLSILILLQLRQRVTAEALAAEFEVSVRTIYRDIDELSAAGLPVFGDRGPGGGFQLSQGYRTRLTGLAADEAEALFMIGLPGPAEALGLGSASRSAGRKLLASLPSTWRKDGERLGARFHLDPVEWYRTAEPVGPLRTIARAVLDQQAVEMSYESWTGVREWLVEPLGMILKAGAWYVVARGGGAIRTFKVSNIRRQTVQDIAFERPIDFDLAAWWTAALIRFESDLRPGIAVLQATSTGLKRLAQLGAYAAEAVGAAKPPDPGGWAEVALPIETVKQAALMLLGIGPEIIVVEPPNLRSRLRALAEDTVKLATVETKMTL